MVHPDHQLEKAGRSPSETFPEDQRDKGSLDGGGTVLQAGVKGGGRQHKLSPVSWSPRRELLASSPLHLNELKPLRC